MSFEGVPASAHILLGTNADGSEKNVGYCHLYCSANIQRSDPLFYNDSASHERDMAGERAKESVILALGQLINFKGD